MFRNKASVALGGVLTIAVIWIAALTYRIVSFSHQSNAFPADAAVVLGAAVANSQPTPVFEQRIQHGITLFRNGDVRTLVLTGGVGAGDNQAESVVARNYCLAHGVPQEALLIETESHSTEENLRNAKPLLEANQLRRTLLVSDPLHMYRAIKIARDLGIDAYPSPTPTTRYVGLASQTRFAAREVYFYARYLLKQLVT
ncbi:MAG: YdcF family protein [Blastocatellales bacterium]